jgi:putative ABC transport system permease protein
MATVTAGPATGSMADTKLPKSHLRLGDVFGVGTVGMRTRRLRTALTALGIAIGIAALVATMGISSSSRADLNAKLNALGPNRLEVQAGQSFRGSDSSLPEDAVAMIRRIGPVEQTSGVTTVDVSVRRTNFIDPNETGGISVQATDPELLSTVGGRLRKGRFLDAATQQYPAVVLGAQAADALGITSLEDDPAVYVGGQWFTVIGILEPIPLYPNLDSAAFIGNPIAQKLFDASTSPGTVYVVTAGDQVEAVENVLGPTANPEAPNEVNVTRPSDAFAAKNAANDTLTALLLALGGVALLVGGIGIANVMVIGVLERRTEIGVRRAVGATRRHIRLQFLLEAVMLSCLGGVIGVVFGIGVTFVYTQARNMVLSIPLVAIAGGVGAALVVGAIAGLSPAGRAAKLAPADAIRPA